MRKRGLSNSNTSATSCVPLRRRPRVRLAVPMPPRPGEVRGVVAKVSGEKHLRLLLLLFRLGTRVGDLFFVMPILFGAVVALGTNVVPCFLVCCRGNSPSPRRHWYRLLNPRECTSCCSRATLPSGGALCSRTVVFARVVARSYQPVQIPLPSSEDFRARANEKKVPRDKRAAPGGAYFECLDCEHDHFPISTR